MILQPALKPSTIFRPCFVSIGCVTVTPIKNKQQPKILKKNIFNTIHLIIKVTPWNIGGLLCKVTYVYITFSYLFTRKTTNIYFSYNNYCKYIGWFACIENFSNWVITNLWIWVLVSNVLVLIKNGCDH